MCMSEPDSTGIRKPARGGLVRGAGRLVAVLHAGAGIDMTAELVRSPAMGKGKGAGKRQEDRSEFLHGFSDVSRDPRGRG